MIIKDWNIEEMTGYKPITTFYIDFSIADKLGVKAIKDTYTRAFNEWKDYYKYLTELNMVLSWKSFEHDNNREYCELYSDLFYELRDYCFDNLKGEELKYYISTTD